MSKSILIVGGTGLIGKTIYEMLSKRNSSLKILIGTRKKNVSPNYIQIDVNDKEAFESLNKYAINLVIVCTKDTNNYALDYAIKNKIDYIDITKPTNELIKAHQFAQERSIENRVVFSSGWMSGIAPLLLYSKGVLANEIEKIKILVYYSTKDKAGKSSADFMAENVSKPFFYYQNNIQVGTKHFLNSEYHGFDFDGQKRKVYDFDIPDLYIFNQIEKIPTVVAKLTFDSKLITSALAFMQRIRFFKILNFKERKLIFGGSGNGDISSFEIFFSHRESQEEKVVLTCQKGQSELTALSTVLHVEKILINNISNGVYFSHQLHNPKEFIASLTSNSSISID